MEIREIADGVITIEMQPEEAMVLAIACRVAEEAAYSGNQHIRDGKMAEKRYVMYRAIFEALAVAGSAQYSIIDKGELKAAALTAMRAVKH